MATTDVRTGLSARESGQILVVTAITMVALLGIAALALDVSYMFDKRNRLHAAADAAAKSAAIEVFRNPTVSLASLEAFADQQVAAHGFSPTRLGGTTTVVVNHGPLSGAFTGLSNYVEAIVSENTSTFFAKVIGWTSLTPTARSVAGTSSGLSCLITLGAPTSLTLANNAHLDMPLCNAAVNGNASIGGGTISIVAASFGVTGTCTGTCTAITTGVPPVPDPLATLPIPSNPYSTPTSYVLGNNQPPATLPPGWYSKIDIGNNDTLTLTPGGLYYVTGPIRMGNSATINGSGVLIYLAGTAASGACLPSSTAGCFDIPNSATVTLSAQTSGTYRGILFFQPSTNQLTATFGNSGALNMSGAMYFPNASVSYGNSTASNDCTLFVAKTISIGGGNSTFSNTCSAYGGSPILTVTIAE